MKNSFSDNLMNVGTEKKIIS